MRPLRHPTQAETVAGLVALAALVAIAGFLFALRPKQSEEASLKREIAATQTRLAAARALAGQKPQAIRGSELFQLSQAMPDAPDMPGLLLQLNDLANAAGITLTAISPLAPQQQAGYQVLPIRLVFEGDYYRLTDLLYRMRTLVSVRNGSLETAGRLFSVDAISFSPGATGFPALKAAIDVSAFSYGTASTGAAR